MDDGEDVQQVTTETPSFEGPDAARAAAAEVREQREIRRRGDGDDKPLSVKDAGRALAGERNADKAQALMDRGLKKDHAVEVALDGEPLPKVIGYQAPEGRENEPLKARDASKLLAAYREGELAKQRVAELLGENEAPAADNVTELEPAAEPATKSEPPTPAEVEAARHARAHMHNMLESAKQTVEFKRATEWGDVKTREDAFRIAQNDPERWARLQEFAKTEDFVREQVTLAAKAAGTDQAETWNEYAKQQDELAEKAIPELADPKYAVGFQRACQTVLNEVGVTDAELRALYNGKAKVDFRDSRVQQVIADAARWRNAQAKAGNVTRRPMPQVQRPGTSNNRASGQQESLERLTRRVENAGNSIQGAKAGAALLAARRAARR